MAPYILILTILGANGPSITSYIEMHDFTSKKNCNIAGKAWIKMVRNKRIFQKSELIYICSRK